MYTLNCMFWLLGKWNVSICAATGMPQQDMDRHAEDALTMMQLSCERLKQHPAAGKTDVSLSPLCTLRKPPKRGGISGISVHNNPQSKAPDGQNARGGQHQGRPV